MDVNDMNFLAKRSCTLQSINITGAVPSFPRVTWPQRCYYNRNLYACNKQGFQWSKKSFIATGERI